MREAARGVHIREGKSAAPFSALRGNYAVIVGLQRGRIAKAVALQIASVYSSLSAERRGLSLSATE